MAVAGGRGHGSVRRRRGGTPALAWLQLSFGCPGGRRLRLGRPASLLFRPLARRIGLFSRAVGGIDWVSTWVVGERRRF